MDARPLGDLVEDGMVTIEAAARFLSVGRSTIYVLLDRGDLPSLKIGKARRIPKRALLEYARRQTQGTIR